MTTPRARTCGPGLLYHAPAPWRSARRAMRASRPIATGRRACSQRWRRVHASALSVVGVLVARDQIVLVGFDRFADRNRAAVVGGLIARLAPSELARHVDRLPIGQHFSAVARLRIVGESDALDPVDPGTGDPHVPGARAFVAAISEKDVRRYLGVHWALGDRQLAPSVRGFEHVGARLLRWHWRVSPLVSRIGA